MKRASLEQSGRALALTPAQAKAREYFPRGLDQPTGSFRFSADALLLADFAATTGNRPLRGLDLGCGCGVVGLSLMLRRPAAQFTGLDLSPELTAAATQNAARLGLAERYQAVTGDVRNHKDLAAIPPGAFDLVVANPPYRKINSGRLPPEDLKRAALFETQGDITVFTAAAAYALKNGGRFCCVYDAGRLPELCATMSEHGLNPKRIRPVHSRPAGGALLVLLEGRLGGRPGLKWESPLYLGNLDSPGKDRQE